MYIYIYIYIYKTQTHTLTRHHPLDDERRAPFISRYSEQ